MPSKNQAAKSLRRTIKRVMLDRQEMSVTKLAEIVGHPLSTVSKAVNHGQYPRVQEKIRRALNV